MVRYLHQCGIEILGMPSLIVKLFVLYVRSAMANRYHVRQQRIFSFQSGWCTPPFHTILSR